MSLYFATALIAYLLGSIPFGYILVRLFRGQDIRQTGSGNIGATNVARSAPGLGLATLILDAAKGFCAVAVAFQLGPRTGHWATIVGTSPQTAAIREALEKQDSAAYLLAALAALCAILGHMFPVWLKFRGGKGVATSVGVFLALAPKTLLLALLVFAVIVAAFRYVSLASILATLSFPVIAYAIKDYHSSPALLAAMCLIAALIVFKHRDNIRRLLSGTEHRFQLKRTRA